VFWLPVLSELVHQFQLRVLSQTQKFFIVLVATIFGRYDCHQANAIQNLKRPVTCTRCIVFMVDNTKYRRQADDIFVNCNWVDTRWQ
jgi:hypothetical protein